MSLEAGFIQLDRMAVEQGLMAFAAARPSAGALSGHAIGGVAMRTDDMKSVTHGAFLTESIMVIAYGAARPEKKSLRKFVLQPEYGPDAQTDRGRRFSVARLNEAFADCCPWHAPRAPNAGASNNSTAGRLI